MEGGSSNAIKAECCDECKTYLKIFYLKKDTSIVPAADDLAYVSLDLLVDQEGKAAIGANLLFVPAMLKSQRRVERKPLPSSLLRARRGRRLPSVDRLLALVLPGWFSFSDGDRP